MRAGTAAERLHAVYVEELRQSLVPPVDRRVNRRQTEELIRRARTIGPAVCTKPDATTWIWSDLHLGHEHSRSVFGRPFRTAAAADTAMMEAWYEQVAEDETIICLGDITVDGEALAHHQEWWGKAPGAKCLVLGNHDVDAVNQIHPFEIDWSCPSSVDTYPLGEEEESTMPKSRPPYPAAFRQQMVELVRSGRTPGELAREFEPSAEAIRNWVAQADRDAGKRSDGLRTEEHEEIRRLRRENRQLREEREILAKATAWFARETGPGRTTGS